VATVVEMPLEDGSTILVEVSDDEQRLERVGRIGTVVRNSAETLEEALRRVRPAVTAVLNQARSLASPPDKVKVEFGVKLTAEAGVVIAKATTEANFKLSLEWGISADQSTDSADD
jgi:hypothetical protein